jgi:thioredoxin 1
MDSGITLILKREKKVSGYIIFRGMILFLILLFILYTCNKNENQANIDSSKQQVQTDSIKITFIELGSVNCIPCRMMQPVMKAIEEKYGKQVKVVFYDVWKPEQKRYAQEYNISVIPTQVFLDKNNMEIYRHEGFFPEEEIDAFLRKQGLKPGKQI